MAPVPVIHRKAGEAALANYDYNDIAEGTGIVTFYGYTTQLSGGSVEYHLSENTPPSQTITTQISAAAFASGWYDFDLTAFNLPRTMKGTAYLSAGLGAHNANVVYIQAQIKKYDGSTETDVTSELESPPFTGATGAATEGKNILLEMPVTETHFKKGDILRLTVKLNKQTGASPEVVELGHDPSDRDGAKLLPASTTHTSQLRLYCPFKLDL